MYILEDNILRFDISMDNSLVVDVVQAHTDISHDAPHLGLLYSSPFLQNIKHMAIGAQLHQQIYIQVIGKEPIQGNQVIVFQVWLDFDLSYELIFHVFLLDDGLWYDFEGTYKPSELVPHYIDLSKLTLSEFLPPLEVTFFEIRLDANGIRALLSVTCRCIIATRVAVMRIVIGG